MMLEDDALSIDWNAFGAAELVGNYFAERGDEEVFRRMQEELTELIRDVVATNKSSRGRLQQLGLTDHDVARFYVANSVIHWAARHGFLDVHGTDRDAYLARLFRDCIHDLRVRDVLPLRYVHYMEAKFEEVLAATAMGTDDPHDAADFPLS